MCIMTLFRTMALEDVVVLAPVIITVAASSYIQFEEDKMCSRAITESACNPSSYSQSTENDEPGNIRSEAVGTKGGEWKNRHAMDTVTNNHNHNYCY